MGGRGSDVGGNTIAFIHGSDGESWAQFLQKLLRGPDYGIDSTLHLPDHPDVPHLFSKTQTCAVLVSPSMLEGDYTDFWRKCVDCFHSRTVVLLLGVDTTDLKTALGDFSKRVLQHKCLEVDGTRDAVSSALVKLIEAYEAVELTSKTCKSEYEDDEDVYDRPPPPRQQNGVVKVLPTVVYEQSGGEVMVVLERPADGEVTLATEGGGAPSRHIPMTHVTGGAYSVDLSGLQGTVYFKVMSGDQILGDGSVRIQSRLEQLANLLRKEVNPLALMCSAMGLSNIKRSEAEELDAMLASRLSGARLPLGLTSLLMPDEQSTPDEQEDSRWPTLLHFAAEYNLIKLCEELLRYPSMIHAAVTENKDGLFPCQLAEKHGYTTLQQRLLQYVEDMRLRSAADSGISFENFPAPSPHSSSHHYANDPLPEPSRESLGEFDDSYIDMTGFLPTTYESNGEVFTRLINTQSQCGGQGQGQELPPPQACKVAAGYGYAKPRSYSDGNVKTPYSRQPAESMIEEEGEDLPPPLKPKRGATRSYSVCVPGTSRSREPGASDRSENDDSSGDSVPETIVDRSSAATRDSYLDPDESSSRPTSQTSSGSQSDYERPPNHDSDATDSSQCTQAEEAAVMRAKHSKRNKSVQDKISNFFRKIKPRRMHSASESDYPNSAKAGKKTIMYSKRQSVSSNSSEQSVYQTGKKGDSPRSSSSASNVESERDSGAVCDDHGSPVLLRSRGKPSGKIRNSGKKDGNGTMDRRLSVRVQKAKKEAISETPNLPSRGSGRQSTKEPSFISYTKSDV